MTGTSAANTWQTQHRLLAEQIRDELVMHRAGRRAPDERSLRLLVAASDLLRQHRVDGRGRCRACHRARLGRLRPRTTCTPCTGR